MNEMVVNFNGQDYIATYNKDSGYYEIDITAPKAGGIYNASIKYTDLLEENYEESKTIQVFAKEKIKIEQNKVFMWIFDWKDFCVKDIVEISDYEINIDEETNANSFVKVLKKNTAKAKDIIAIKKNNEVIYWGVIDNITNENGKLLYEYTLKYITNMFNEKVPLSQNTDKTIIENGVYKIKTFVDPEKVVDVENSNIENGANVHIWTNNKTSSQKWRLTRKEDIYYTFENINSNKMLDVHNGNFANNTNVRQYEKNNQIPQDWKIEQLENSCYKIRTRGNASQYLDVHDGLSKEGNNIKIYESNTTKAQKFFLERLYEEIIKDEGVEDFIAKMINENFINSKDTFANRNYLEVRIKTHTKLKTTVTNVEDKLFNLHTWMTNCTQLYNINYNIFIENKKLIIEIENKTIKKELIDVKAQAISNYSEVFNTDIVSKVEVLTDTDTYYLYLLNDRTTTTDITNENRAEGKTERVYTANYEDANQKALDAIKSNTYNHNITFDIYNKFMKIGTPIAIKTKESIIYDTYISALKITPKKFITYTCGNIRTKLIDKLLKERK